MPERIRMQATPVDLNAEQFLQTDITEMDIPSKIIQQGKLAWLVRGFEHDCVESEGTHEPLCIRGIQLSIVVEQSYSLCAFPCFNNELDGARIEPFLSLVNPPRERAVVEPAVMFLAELHLNIEAATLCSDDDLTWIEMTLGETLTAFDSSDPHVGAQIQVCRKLPLGHGNFKWSPTCHGGNAVRAGGRDFDPGRAFIRHNPARH